jgi:N-hydroxyarylamine O-acetyltransferase
MGTARKSRWNDGDDWGIATLDLNAYLKRIDHPPVTAPTAAALSSLHEAHVRAIPFENVDVVLGRRIRLGLDAISDKIVRRQRGGYCYEHALLFAAVLQRLGFPVARRLARVQPDTPGARTHMMLIVEAEGTEYLADVGFGAGVLRPMPLRDGVESEQAGWPHRLDHGDAGWTLSRRNDDGWTALHRFDDTPQWPVDFEVANQYVSTHPRSPFTGRLVIFRLDPGIARRLLGTELTIEYADGQIDRTPITPDRLSTTLRDLGVNLAEDDINALEKALGNGASRVTTRVLR